MLFRSNKPARSLTTEAERKLLEYPWYGNIRELEHTIEKAVIIADGEKLTPDCFHLPRKTFVQEANEDVSTLEEMEKQMIVKAINQCDGNLSAVALRLGITRQTLYNKMKKFSL